MEDRITKSVLNGSNLEKSIGLALKYALDFPSLWASGDIGTKRSIQYMVFPEGIGYDFKNKRVQTFRVNSIFTAILSISRELTGNKKGDYHTFDDNSLLVTSTGLPTVFHLPENKKSTLF